MNRQERTLQDKKGHCGTIYLPPLKRALFSTREAARSSGNLRTHPIPFRDFRQTLRFSAKEGRKAVLRDKTL
jgi:hypothetical protein